MQQRLQEALAVADVAGARARLASLEASAAEGAVWEDPQRAQQLMAQINSIRCNRGAPLVAAGRGCPAASWRAAPYRAAARAPRCPPTRTHTNNPLQVRD